MARLLNRVFGWSYADADGWGGEGREWELGIGLGHSLMELETRRMRF